MIPSQPHRANHGFGWVGEWLCIRTELGHKSTCHSGLIKIETLYYADKEKIDSYILSLIVCLHYFISLLRPGKNCSFARSPAKSPISFPSLKISAKSSQTTPSSLLTVEEREMLRGLKFHEVSPRISKSQELQIVRPRMSKYHRLGKSSNHSPENEHESRMSLLSIANFGIDHDKALDVIDWIGYTEDLKPQLDVSWM